MTRTYGCGNCTETFDNLTDRLVHVSTAHTDHLGVGRQRSRPWSCWRCAGEVQPLTTQCPHCGWTRPEEGASQ